jgi:hypothetical protein
MSYGAGVGWSVAVAIGAATGAVVASMTVIVAAGGAECAADRDPERAMRAVRMTRMRFT